MPQVLELMPKFRHSEIEDLKASGNWPRSRADGYSGGDGTHTVSFKVSGFAGKIFLEATLATDPAEQFDADGNVVRTDWFPILIGNNAQAYIVFDEDEGTESTVARSFAGNFVWLRARVEDNTRGSISSVLVAF